jgi:hypothetical protein
LVDLPLGDGTKLRRRHAIAGDEPVGVLGDGVAGLVVVKQQDRPPGAAQHQGGVQPRGATPDNRTINNHRLAPFIASNIDFLEL